MLSWFGTAVTIAYTDHQKARLFCVGIYLGASIILLVGAALSVILDDHECVNRAGGLITALSLLLILSQFQFEERHRGEEVKVANRAAALAETRQYPLALSKEVVVQAQQAAENRFLRTRYMLVSSTVLIGALGEIVHSLGDVLLDPLLTLM